MQRLEGETFEETLRMLEWNVCSIGLPPSRVSKSSIAVE